MNRNFKRISAVAMIVTASVSALGLAACGGEKSSATYKVYMPDGAPAVALSALMDGGYEGASFTVVPATKINDVVASGTADFAIMPVNAAAALYNAGKDIVMLSVNTHGNLYMIGDGEEMNISELGGKKIGVIGEGQVPDITFRILVTQAGLKYERDGAGEDTVSVTYVAEPSAFAALFQTKAIDYAVLAEPAVTTLSGKLKKSIVTDMQEQWRDAFDSEYPQACLVAKGEIVRNDKAFVDKFIAAVRDGDDFAEKEPEKALAAVKTNVEAGFSSTLAALTKESAARCNIATESAADAKAGCEAFFGKLTTIINKLGAPMLAKLPDDGFYYKG